MNLLGIYLFMHLLIYFAKIITQFQLNTLSRITVVDIRERKTDHAQGYPLGVLHL
jgi:hypothetical protein